MKISEIITDKYKLRMPPTVYYDLLADVLEAEDEQEPVLDKVRAEITKYEGDCRLSVAEYQSCKQCTDNMFETIYGILGKYNTESEVKE